MITELSAFGRCGSAVGTPGGQGSVFRLDGQPGHLVKLYHDECPVNPEGLEALVGWRASLDERHRRALDDHTSWPQAVVRDRGRLGVVFREAPPRFMMGAGVARRLRDLQFAYCERGAGYLGVEPPGVELRIRIALAFAAVLELLHRDGVVYGDASHTNLAWARESSTPGGGLPIFVIDADSAWVTSAPRGLPRASTPQWGDRRRGPDGADTARDQDLFQLALVFMRVWYRQNVNVEADTARLRLPPTPTISEDIAGLLVRALHHSDRRPSAAEWVGALAGQLDLVRSVHRHNTGA